MATVAADTETKTSRRYLAVSLPLALTIAYAISAGILITLRAVVDDLDFLSTGWILLLALVPLVPWLIPALAPVAGRIAPFVKQVKLPGGIEISLSAAERTVTGLGTVEQALTSDHLVQGLANTATPFTTTDAAAVIQGIKTVRSAAAAAIVVDLSTGMKWRMPNLYFVAWLVANDPVTRWLVFTEFRVATPGLFVGVCSAAELRTRIEAAYPAYAVAGQQLEYSDPTNLQNEQHLADQFNKIRAAVAPVGAETPTLGWMSTPDIRAVLGPSLSTAAVNWTGELDRAGLETIVRSSSPYVAATTADGVFRGLLDQRSVALEFSRRVLESN